jgi:hypothetical protein
LALAVCVSSAGADSHYVDPKSPEPAAPHTSPKTASHDIQSAVDAAEIGDTVQVAAGTYKIEKELVVAKAITVQGPGADLATIDAEGKCRCVSLKSGATLKGFTLTGGKARDGGGVLCRDGATLAECTITNNAAEHRGGGVKTDVGAKPCLVVDCKIIGNRSLKNYNTDNPMGGGGVFASLNTTVRNCLIQDNQATQRGGGIWCHEGSAIAENCTIVGNRAVSRGGNSSMQEGGGGAFCDFGGQLRNCLVYGNHANAIGGGAVLSTGGAARNCTFTANTAGASGGGVQTVGVAGIVNSVLYGNTRGPKDKGQSDDLYVSHYYHADIHQLSLGKAHVRNCCIGSKKIHVTRQRFYLGPTAGYSPNWYKNTLNETNCIEQDPGFVAPDKQDYRLKKGSLCIDAGLKEAWMENATDLDGHPRVQGSTVDIGCHEDGPDASSRPVGNTGKSLHDPRSGMPVPPRLSPKP